MINAYGGGLGSTLGYGSYGFGMSHYNTLSSDVVLIISDLVIDSLLENVSLVQQHMLSVSDTSVSTLLENVDLDQYILLNQPGDITLSTVLDTISVVQAHTLAVDDLKVSLTTSLLKIIDWDGLDYYFGVYRRKDSELGSFQTENTQESGIYKPDIDNKTGIY